MNSILRICAFLSVLVAQPLHATSYVLNEGSDVIGKVRYAFPESGETLAEVGLRFDIGFNEMQRANPQVAPNQILSNTLRLLIPSQFILPQVPRKGIVVNLAEFRLYYFLPNENIVLTFPVGIGRQGWDTPLGSTQIVSKQANPVWRPTEKVREEAEKNGFQLPEFFPANKANPLGKYALRLGWPTILIHGTNRPDGIGERVSAGCIRMLASDIEYLFAQVPVGTKVRVINQAVTIEKLRVNPVPS